MNLFMYILAILVLIAGIILGFHFTNVDGNPSPSWMQTGSMASLLLVTVIYARSAVHALKEAEESRSLAHKALEEGKASRIEAEKARKDALRPTLAIRYLWKNLDPNGNTTTTSKKRTLLINVGAGPAINIKVYSNFERVLAEINQRAKSIRHTELKPWPTQETTFGIPIGPDTGNVDVQIEFMSKGGNDGFYSPVEDPEVIYFVKYLDSFNQIYVTVLSQGRQSIFGPISRKEVSSLFNKYQKEAQT